MVTTNISQALQTQKRTMEHSIPYYGQLSRHGQPLQCRTTENSNLANLCPGKTEQAAMKEILKQTTDLLLSTGLIEAPT